MGAPERYDLDLGHDHFLSWSAWKPDRKLNPQFAHLPDNPRIGAIIRHKTLSGDWCEGSILFEGETGDFGRPSRHKWKVESWEPLTLSPSLLCACGDHGFIREGKWIRA